MTPRHKKHVPRNRFVIGAIALVTIGVALVLSVHIERGIPLAPSRTLYVDLRNASGLNDGNKVHVGGAQVGTVTGLSPVRLADGAVIARAKLRLDQGIGPVPVDSAAAVRPLSALGLKYVQLTLGRSSRPLRDGATLPEARTRIPIDVDRLYSMFDAPTRRAVRENELGYGDALTARGDSLNRLIAGAPPLAKNLDDAMRNLARREADLHGFFRGLDRFTQAVEPVSVTSARLFTNMADTFAAFSTDDGKPLRDTIARQPATLEVGTRSLRVTRPFLRHLAALSGDLRGAAEELDVSLPPTTAALRTAAPVTRQSTTLSGHLERTLQQLDRLVAARTSRGALRGLTATVTSLKPQLRYLGPFMTVCNYWNTFWTNFAGVSNEPVDHGTSNRAIYISDSSQDDQLSHDNSNEFAHGKHVQAGGVPEYLHEDTFGLPAITADGRANCRAGQAGYPERGAAVVPDQDAYGRVVLRPSSRLGRAGPTYKTFDELGHGHGLNPDRVPPGQTFSATPGGVGFQP